MRLNLTSCKNPRWADAEKKLVYCEVTFAEYGGTVLPFVASEADPEEHGHTLFVLLRAGKYGKIAAYVAPEPPKLTLTVGRGPRVVG